VLFYSAVSISESVAPKVWIILEWWTVIWEESNHDYVGNYTGFFVLKPQHSL